MGRNRQGVEKPSPVRSASRLLIALCLFLGLTAPAHSSTKGVEFSKAVSRWFVPLEKDGRFRKYEVDLTQTRDLATNEVSAFVSVVRVGCTKENVSGNQVAFRCGRGPNHERPAREWTSEVAELDMADDMSSATATFEVAGETHVIHFQEPEDTSGIFDRRRVCGTSGVQLVAGMFENMDRAYGRVLGQRLATQRVNSYDHAWLERAYGTWC